MFFTLSCSSVPLPWLSTSEAKLAGLAIFISFRSNRAANMPARWRAPSGSPGQWAFAPVKAITYVSQSSTEWYVEHGLTHYSATKSMGFTFGHSNAEGMRYRTFDPGAWMSLFSMPLYRPTGPRREPEHRTI